MVLDVHAHILPGIDDGAKNLEEAKKMLNMAISQGICEIIASPHYSGKINSERIRELAKELEEEAKQWYADFRIYPGQEILYFDSMIEALKAGEVLTLADSRYVLVEFMPTASYKKIYQGIRKIQQGGYYPVLAHVERYEAMRREEQFLELLNTGCLMQMNYGSIRGGMFDKQACWCRKQLKKERIHLLGTDMHGSNHRTPVIEKSMDWMRKELPLDYLKKITWEQGMDFVRQGKK